MKRGENDELMKQLLPDGDEDGRMIKRNRQRGSALRSEAGENGGAVGGERNAGGRGLWAAGGGATNRVSYDHESNLNEF